MFESNFGTDGMSFGHFNLASNDSENAGVCSRIQLNAFILSLKTVTIQWLLLLLFMLLLFAAAAAAVFLS
jgi:hypothetical protein